MTLKEVIPLLPRNKDIIFNWYLDDTLYDSRLVLAKDYYTIEQTITQPNSIITSINIVLNIVEVNVKIF